MSDARSEILAAVRRALGPAREPTDRAPRGRRATPEEPGHPTDIPDALVDLFVRRATEYRATVTRSTTARLGEDLRHALGESDGVVVPEGLDGEVRAALDGLPGVVPDLGQSARQLDRLDAVLTTASAAIAETGTLVLEHRGGQGRRALSLVPDLHVCVVRRDQLVADVPVALTRVNPLLPQTWISGPSATSDIELERVEGVHGPRSLHIVVLEPAPEGYGDRTVESATR